MIVNDEADTLQAAEDDPRITRIGKFLRKTGLDEGPPGAFGARGV
jgi:putative colanic acid biosynthesis UDP-glucose lipid carrier transferase